MCNEAIRESRKYNNEGLVDMELLVIEAKNGSKAAEVEILDRFKRFIVKKALDVRVKNYDLDDLVQIGYIAVLNAIEKYDYEKARGGFVSYVTKCIQNRFYHLIRNKAACHLEITMEQEDSANITICEKLADDFLVEDDYIEKETIKELRIALKMLALKDREVIEQTFFRGYTLKEYSITIGIGYPAVVQRRRRALLKLRAILSSTIFD